MASLNYLIPKLLLWEGGYSNDPDDSGNWYKGNLIGTNKGISAPVLAEYLGRTPTVEDMQNLDTDTFMEITKNKFWNKIHGDEINDQHVAELVCDWVYNSGSAAIRSVQFAAGMKADDIDGVVGSKTIAAINANNGKELFEKIKALRIEYLNDIATGVKAKYLKGWLRRVNSFVYQ